jgi:hypothetical protein
LSDRKATSVLATVAQSLGHDVYELNINHSSIHRRAQHYRAKIVSQLKEQFQGNVSLEIHWDGKLLRYFTGKEVVDRLPVIVAGAGVNQLLGVPKLTFSRLLVKLRSQS